MCADHPPALVQDAGEHRAHVLDALLSPGCRIRGGSVHGSILSPDVLIEPGALVEDSILMPRVRIGSNCVVRRAIIDENVLLPPGVRIGCDPDDDRRRFTVTEGKVVVVPSGNIFA